MSSVQNVKKLIYPDPVGVFYIGQYIISFPFTSPFVSVILRSCLLEKIKVVFHSDFGAFASHETHIATYMASCWIHADECFTKREKITKCCSVSREKYSEERCSVIRSSTYYVMFKRANF